MNQYNEDLSFRPADVGWENKFSEVELEAIEFIRESNPLRMKTFTDNKQIQVIREAAEFLVKTAGAPESSIELIINKTIPTWVFLTLITANGKNVDKENIDKFSTDVIILAKHLNCEHFVSDFLVATREYHKDMSVQEAANYYAGVISSMNTPFGSVVGFDILDIPPTVDEFIRVSEFVVKGAGRKNAGKSIKALRVLAEYFGIEKEVLTKFKEI